MVTERWLLAAYACSGFAGLVYEIAWTRLLILHLGHTTAAVSTVTAAFMGGLGLGGALGGRVASRLNRRQALWTYALLELAVALASVVIAGSLTLTHAVVRMGIRRGWRRPCLLVRAACVLVRIASGTGRRARRHVSNGRACRRRIVGTTGRAGRPAVWREHGWRRDRLAGGGLRSHPGARPHGHDGDRYRGQCR